MVRTSIVAEEAERFGCSGAATGGTRTAHRRCCTSSTRCGSNISATRSISIGSATNVRGPRWRERRALDVGCGAGLLAEPLARLGRKGHRRRRFAPELIAAARDHAKAHVLEIDYRAGELPEIEGQFDLITCMEVIEHVADPAAFVSALAKRLAPAGLLILSTPNATAWSRLLMITVAEGLGHIPRGTHDFDKFIAPERMKMLLATPG